MFLRHFSLIFVCCLFLEKDKAEKTFAFSFVSLMRPDGTTISDGTHELCVYKVWHYFKFTLAGFKASQN